VIVAASAGLRHLALRKGRELWGGLAVLRSRRGGSLVAGFVLLAVFGQILRNWLLLHAVGVDASFFDAIAVLIAVVTLGQLPVGPSVGAAAAVLILGRDGVAAAAAAGVLMTATGTVGGLCFAGWAGADQLWLRSRRAAGPPCAVPEPEPDSFAEPSSKTTMQVQALQRSCESTSSRAPRRHAGRRPHGEFPLQRRKAILQTSR